MKYVEKNDVGVVKNHLNEKSGSSKNVPVLLEQLEQRLVENFNQSQEQYKLLLNNIEEIRNCLKRNEVKKLKVVFFVQLGALWNSTYSVWDAFDKEKTVECTIVAMPFIHASARKNPYEVKEFLLAEGIPFVDWQEYDMEEHRPDLIFFQSPYDISKPDTKFTASAIAKKGIRMAYIPYGLECGGRSVDLAFQFNQAIHNLAWRVFSRSERNKAMYGKYCARGNEHVVVTGHPKMDRLFHYRGEDADPVLLKKIQNRKVFLWAPHFLTNKQCQCSTFLKFKKFIPRFFAQRKDIALILRPHPLLYENIVTEGDMTTAEVEHYFHTWSKMDNIYWDQQDVYSEAFYYSDALLADVGSFLLEYLVTDKPVLFLHDEYTQPMNEDGEEIKKYYYNATNEFELVNFIEMIVHGKDPMREARIAVKNEFLYGIDGKVGERIKNYVCEHLREEKDWK